MKKRISLGLIFFLMMATTSFSQTPFRDQPTQTTTGFLQQASRMGLLDPSRISMNHQMGMSYSSLGGAGYTQGYYLNTISYRFDAPVMLNLRLGLTNNPFSSSGSFGTASNLGMGDMEFFGGADLDWRPADNVFVRFSFDRYPAGMYNMNPFSYRNPFYSTVGSFPSALYIDHDDPFHQYQGR